MALTRGNDGGVDGGIDGGIDAESHGGVDGGVGGFSRSFGGVETGRKLAMNRDYLANALRQHREGKPHDVWEWDKCSDEDWELADKILLALGISEE